MKVEDKAEDEDLVEAMDKDVVMEEEELRKIILKREEIKIFLEVMEKEEQLIKDTLNAIHVERMVIILGSVIHQKKKRTNLLYTVKMLENQHYSLHSRKIKSPKIVRGILIMELATI